MVIQTPATSKFKWKLQEQHFASMNLVGAMSSASVDYNDKETAHKFPNVSQTGEGYAQTKNNVKIVC
jgi:hypothetical protein